MHSVTSAPAAVETSREPGGANRVRVYGTFDALPDGLLDDSQPESLFCTRSWFQNLAETGLDPNESVRLYAVESGNGSPQCLFPCRFQDGELSPLANYYSSYYAPPLQKSASIADAVGTFVSHLRREKPAWDIINLRPMDPDSEVFRELERAFRREGFISQRYFLYGNLYLDVAGRTYAEYAKGLSSVITNNLKRAGKQLLQTGRARVEVIRAGTLVDSAIAAYETVYQNSWKKDEARPEFIRNLVRMCADLGWLRLGIVYLDGEPAAAQIWITRNGTASIYKVAYDERFAKLSLGTVLTAHLMQVALDEDRVACVDFLSGDDEYKSRWMSHRRERWGLLVMNPRTPKGLLAVVRNVVGGWVKSRAKMWRSRTAKPAPAGKNAG